MKLQLRLALAASLASGFAALVFEVLLFRRLELLLGRSVEASALIFAAYMAGLALGSLLALRPVSQHHPRRWYVALELWIGLTGVVLIVLLPAAQGLVAALPASLAALAALLVLLLPTVAMGWVLPLLAQLSLPQAGQFRRGFPMLYAANTFGAMLGAVAAVALLRGAGLPLAAVTAALANLLAASLVLGLPATAAAPVERPGAGRLPLALLLAAALAGAALLSLEVIWMRAMLLFLRATDWSLAILLSVVIGGLSLGAWLAPRWPAVAFAGLALFGLGLGHLLWGRVPLPATEAGGALLAGLLLAGLTSLASGGIFARLAMALRQHAASSQRSGAALLVANTLGAAAGALLAAYAWLPLLGLHGSWMLAAGIYLLLLMILRPRPGTVAMAAAGLLVLLAWPEPQQRWFGPAVAQFRDYQLVERREARDATLQLARRDLAGQAVAWRLVTDNYSMTGTEADSLRYMRLFAQLPQALHPGPETALLISYGLGTTAAALLADPALDQLVVADTSRQSLRLSGRIHANDPLADPRVSVRIDDGRHVLLATGRQFDLITAEPPPPRVAGAGHLFSREYFALVRARLAPGGMATHWLPVDQLSPDSTAAIVRGFCAEFADCSLWAGSHYNWILLGSRDAEARVDRQRLQRLWRSEPSRQLLAASGLERPAQLLTTFIADARQLRAWLGPGPVLDDDHPGRLELRPVHEAELRDYFAFMDDRATQRRFETSAWIDARVAPGLRQQATRLWLWQALMNGQVSGLPPQQTAQLSALALSQGLAAPVRQLLGWSPAELQAGQQQPGPSGAPYRGVAALLAGEWSAASRQLRAAPDDTHRALGQVADCFAAGQCQVKAEGVAAYEAFQP